MLKSLAAKAIGLTIHNETEKDTGNNAQVIPDMLCYCFGWTKTAIAYEIAQTGTTKALHDIRFKMKIKGCSCATLNPTGQCCVADVKQFIREKKEASQ